MPVSREDGLDVASRPLEVLNGDYEPGIQRRLISQNSDTGGGHMVVEIPPGWSNPRGYCSASQDILLLAGDLTNGNEKMIANCYAFIPEGVAHGPLSSEKGCKALVFYGGSYDFTRSEDHKDGAEIERYCPNEKTWDIPWEDPMKEMVERTTFLDEETGNPTRPAGVLVKVLRWDKDPEEQIALVAQAPGCIDPGTEVHPHNECLYLISGDCYIGYTYDTKSKDDKKVGIVLTKDNYISRPPGIYHGPVTTHNGVYWITYMSDGYHGIFNDVPEWRDMTEGYFETAAFK